MSRYPRGVRHQHDGDRLVQHSDAGHANGRLRHGIPGWQRTAGGRPLRQHGVPFGGGSDRISNGTTLPTVKVLVQGLKLPVYGADGSYIGDQFSSNPAWMLLDVLRRAGWSLTEIDVASFAAAAAYCDETDRRAGPLRQPDSVAEIPVQPGLADAEGAGDLVRGVRNSSRLMLTYGANGALQLRVENSLALEMPAKPAWSNSTQPLEGGWPSYEFGDGGNGFSGIMRRPTGEPSFRCLPRSIADTPNLLTVEFQDP